MRSLALAISVLAISAPSVFAQIQDPEQRKSWFYLHHLAGDANLIERCVVLRLGDRPSYDATAAWAKYNKITNELAMEVESYVARYAGRRGKQETVHAFTYRVWWVAIMAGDDKAKEATSLTCGPILGAP